MYFKDNLCKSFIGFQIFENLPFAQFTDMITASAGNVEGQNVTKPLAEQLV